MGNELIQQDRGDVRLDHMEAGLRAIPWLDALSAGLVRAIARELALHHPDAVAMTLFGSIARHDERPLTDSEPSDVDLLLLIDEHAPEGHLLDIVHAIGETSHRLGYAPRDVQPVLVERDLTSWDPLFVANVARDGILLWARGPLPSSLAALS